MNSFHLLLQDATHAEEIGGVTSFVGEDASGSFGIRASHARFMTLLVMGLARFRTGEEDPWQYLALPGALLYFRANRLTLTCQHYLRDDDYGRISTALAQQLLAEEEQLRGTRESLRRMERELFKRLGEWGKTAYAG
ncbi:MAG: F0F1 ATP synthase subunit epsilon [Gammaproteobacteria bacterium]|nr:F0F1 ATP synthase subunit epsilon [Gammaproteobacteria bacterium]MBU1655441.1 F0F1 ATP synthase subunit epsilon [Gammaproteobacteria bacterium]MBU1962408.1 F0F1 ATP synthase subunit epsilon [Gammaproteobacteria bacterium]